MWVHPDWRGAGLGSRLLRHLEALCAGLGHDRVVLDTNGTLDEAIAMYERAGYNPIERYNDNPYAQAWFVKALETRCRLKMPDGRVPGPPGPSTLPQSSAVAERPPRLRSHNPPGSVEPRLSNFASPPGSRVVNDNETP